ncbi:MAG: hypothetical protein WA876_02500 [Candidatus Acidiferrales bacterium]
MATKQPAFEKAVEQIHAILNEHLSGLPAREQRKKWDDLERYLSAVAPDVLPERRAKRRARRSTKANSRRRPAGVAHR